MASHRLTGLASSSGCLVAAVIALGLLAAVVVVAPARAAVPGSSVAADTGVPAGAQYLGALPADQRIPLAISLTPRDRAGLENFDTMVSDPASPLFRRFLTESQYLARFGVPAARVSRVAAALRQGGLRVTGISHNRQVVDVTGTAAAIDAFFDVALGRYDAPSDGSFYATDAGASVPAGIGPDIAFVSGLTNRTAADPTAVRAIGRGPASGDSPATLRSAYDMDSVVSSEGGTGRTSGLLEFDAFTQSDINNFTQTNGLPSITPAVVPVDGGVPTPGSGQVEVTLDIDAVAVDAPKASQVVYEAPNTDSAWTDEWARIASDNRIDTLSVSWLLGEACENGPISATHNSILQMAAQGITVLSASGDWGAFGCDYNGDNTTLQVDYPASDPNVTGVGGTSLTTASNGQYQSESVWNNGTTGSTRSGGGYSQIYSTPSWQTAVNNTTHRSVPDVAAPADPYNGGLNIVVNGASETVGGTSEASPLWAGFTTDVAQQAGRRLGSIDPTVYQTAESSAYASDFHDIIQGTNGHYSAGPGYDLATGWGSPVGARLITALSGGTSPPPTNDFSVWLNPSSGSVSPGGSASVTVTTAVTTGSAQIISLSASGLPPGVSATFTPSSVTAGSTSTLTIGATSATSPGTYVVTVTGTGTDATHSTPYTLTVTGSSGGTGDIVNGGFETGTLTGWTRTGTTSVVTKPVHSGGYAAVIGPSSQAALSQTFTAHAGTALSLWYRQEAANATSHSLAVILLTDATTGQVRLLAETVSSPTNTAYTHLTALLTLGHRYTISVQNNDLSVNGSGVTYLDDVADTPQTITTAKR